MAGHKGIRRARPRRLRDASGKVVSVPQFEQPRAGLKQDVIVVFTSTTGRAPWHPVKKEETPEWVQHPDVMARMLGGEDVMKPDEGPKGSNFYRAIRLSEINEALKADH